MQICYYCGKQRENVGFFIGAAPSMIEGITEWVMWEHTGKQSCDTVECYAKGKAQSKAALNQYLNK